MQLPISSNIMVFLGSLAYHQASIGNSHVLKCEHTIIQIEKSLRMAALSLISSALAVMRQFYWKTDQSM